MKQIKIVQFANAAVAYFDTHIVSNGPDNGARVKHLVYKDDELDAYWHEITYLSRTERPKVTHDIFISKRKFWGKVRLVRHRELMCSATWMTIGRSVKELESINNFNYGSAPKTSATDV